MIGGDFNMTEWQEDKSHDCGCSISEVERLNWNFLTYSLQLHDSFQHNGGIRFPWDNQQLGQERQLAWLDHIYTSKNKTRLSK